MKNISKYILLPFILFSAVQVCAQVPGKALVEVPEFTVNPEKASNFSAYQNLEAPGAKELRSYLSRYGETIHLIQEPPSSPTYRIVCTFKDVHGKTRKMQKTSFTVYTTQFQMTLDLEILDIKQNVVVYKTSVHSLQKVYKNLQEPELTQPIYNRLANDAINQATRQIVKYFVNNQP